MLSPGSADIASEADRLSLLIAKNAEALRAARLGPAFRIEDTSFRLYARARNTVYRISRRFDWFLKLPRSGDAAPMIRERLGADTIDRAMAGSDEYSGAAAVRVSVDPAYVISATIPGKALNRVLFTECWIPTAQAATGLETSFRTLGALLAALHLRGHVGSDTPSATTRPFETLRTLLNKVSAPDTTTDAIAAWFDGHRRPDAGTTFLHGNFRLDNVLSINTRLGFVDFENCGTGSLYQDLSRPVTELLLSRCLVAFPRKRAIRCLIAYLEAYARTCPYDPVTLWEYVGVRLARYQLEALKRGSFAGRVGGIPVVRTKLDGLTLAVLQNRFEDVVPEIAVWAAAEKREAARAG